MSRFRWLLLVLVVAAAASAMYCFRRPPAFETQSIAWSPNGKWIVLPRSAGPR